MIQFLNNYSSQIYKINLILFILQIWYHSNHMPTSFEKFLRTRFNEYKLTEIVMIYNNLKPLRSRTEKQIMQMYICSR